MLFVVRLLLRLLEERAFLVLRRYVALAVGAELHSCHLKGGRLLLPACFPVHQLLLLPLAFVSLVGIAGGGGDD